MPAPGPTAEPKERGPWMQMHGEMKRAMGDTMLRDGRELEAAKWRPVRRLGGGRTAMDATRKSGKRRNMTAATERELRAHLRAQRRALVLTVAVTDEELRTLEDHGPGGRGEDAAAATAVEVLSRLEIRERQALDEIRAAEARLAAGTYGWCEACGVPIPVARLRALAETRCCVACQARAEQPALTGAPPPPVTGA